LKAIWYLLIADLVAILVLSLYYGAVATGRALASKADCIQTAPLSSDSITVTPNPALRLPCGSHLSMARFKDEALQCPPGSKAIMEYITPRRTPVHSCPASNSSFVARYIRGLQEGNYQKPVTRSSRKALEKFIGFGHLKVAPLYAP